MLPPRDLDLDRVSCAQPPPSLLAPENLTQDSLPGIRLLSATPSAGHGAAKHDLHSAASVNPAARFAAFAQRRMDMSSVLSDTCPTHRYPSHSTRGLASGLGICQEPNNITIFTANFGPSEGGLYDSLGRNSVGHLQGIYYSESKKLLWYILFHRHPGEKLQFNLIQRVAQLSR